MSYATTHNDDTTHPRPIMTDARSPMKCMPAIWTPTITREEDAAASKPSLFPKYGNRVARTRSAESYSKLPSAVKMTPTRSETGPTTSEFEVSGRQSARRTSFGHPSPPKLDGWRPASRASAEKDAYGTEDRQAPTSQDTEEERLWGWRRRQELSAIASAKKRSGGGPGRAGTVLSKIGNDKNDRRGVRGKGEAERRGFLTNRMGRGRGQRGSVLIHSIPKLLGLLPSIHLILVHQRPLDGVHLRMFPLTEIVRVALLL
ncbi:hypothetical protein BDQ17DRAFT_1372487, partial [Cyathus striatus]